MSKSRFELVITPPRRFISVNWRELWRYRGLFVVFAWRELAVRYKQTVLGVLWVLLQPFIMMVIFTFIFNRVAGIESGDGTPYPIFLYVGLLLWQYFSWTVSNASNSLVANAGIVQKVYFPRLVLPSSAAITGLVDLMVASVVLVGMMIYYGYHPQLAGVLIIPLLLLIAIFASMGLGLFFASLNLKYRDVRYVLPFIISVLMYLTPVIYPVTFLDGHPVLQSLVTWLNPMSGTITNARAGLLGTAPVQWNVLGIAAGSAFVYLVFGLYYFRATERYFADVV